MTEKNKPLGNAYFQPTHSLLGLAVALVIATSFATAQPAEPLLAQPPAGFADELVTHLAGPTDLAFTPDGRILITQQTGQLRVFENGALLATANPLDALNASIVVNSPNGGAYFLKIDGVGKGDLATGYSDYGSLGQYAINGSVPAANGQAPVAIAQPQQ